MEPLEFGMEAFVGLVLPLDGGGVAEEHPATEGSNGMNPAQLAGWNGQPPGFVACGSLNNAAAGWRRFPVNCPRGKSGGFSSDCFSKSWVNAASSIVVTYKRCPYSSNRQHRPGDDAQRTPGVDLLLHAGVEPRHRIAHLRPHCGIANGPRQFLRFIHLK